jgi:hypothetical protein
MQKFYKGRTNNHLTWVMVDATDFATPESALSAATKIKIYGKLRGATGANFVSSGTGSLTNDIQHVGASALGIYTIALAKADLSDASAAWYDQYIVSLSATGAAYQVLVVDGGIDDSALSDLISNAYSAAVVASSRALVAQSLASDAHSAAAQANSRVLVNQSYLSDIRSHVSDLQSDFQSRVPKAVATNSQLSDLASDLRSYLAGMSGAISDVYSSISAAADASDVASAVAVELASRLSDILSAAQQTNSRVIIIQSQVSDVYSQLSDFRSDLVSLVTTTGVGLNASTMSDLRSAINGLTVSLDASNISDIASAVVAALPITSLVSDAHSAAAQANSRILVIQSRLSDLDSRLVSDLSDVISATAQINSRVLLNQSRISDIYSLVSDLHSDVGVISGVVSDISSGVNVARINNVAITGDGSGTPFGV